MTQQKETPPQETPPQETPLQETPPQETPLQETPPQELNEIPKDENMYAAIESAVKVLKGNEVYRYGDTLNYLKKITEIILKEDKYNGSILKNWLKCPRLSNTQSKHVHLYKVMKRYSEDKKLKPPPDDAMVIHIRAGDDYNGRGLGSPLIWKSLTKNIKNMESKPEITHIILVTALHYGVAEDSKLYGKSHKYSYKEQSKKENIILFEKLIRALNKPVFIRSTDDIDSDFCFLCNAKHFIGSGGGFSKIVDSIHKSVKPKLA
jgi:hypothetical protein